MRDRGVALDVSPQAAPPGGDILVTGTGRQCPNPGDHFAVRSGRPTARDGYAHVVRVVVRATPTEGATEQPGVTAAPGLLRVSHARWERPFGDWPLPAAATAADLIPFVEACMPPGAAHVLLALAAPARGPAAPPDFPVVAFDTHQAWHDAMRMWASSRNVTLHLYYDDEDDIRLGRYARPRGSWVGDPLLGRDGRPPTQAAGTPWGRTLVAPAGATTTRMIEGPVVDACLRRGGTVVWDALATHVPAVSVLADAATVWHEDWCGTLVVWAPLDILLPDAHSPIVGPSPAPKGGGSEALPPDLPLSMRKCRIDSPCTACLVADGLLRTHHLATRDVAALRLRDADAFARALTVAEAWIPHQGDRKGWRPWDEEAAPLNEEAPGECTVRAILARLAHAPPVPEWRAPVDDGCPRDADGATRGPWAASARPLSRRISRLDPSGPPEAYVAMLKTYVQAVASAQWLPVVPGFLRCSHLAFCRMVEGKEPRCCVDFVSASATQLPGRGVTLPTPYQPLRTPVWGHRVWDVTEAFKGRARAQEEWPYAGIIFHDGRDERHVTCVKDQFGETGAPKRWAARTAAVEARQSAALGAVEERMLYVDDELAGARLRHLSSLTHAARLIDALASGYAPGIAKTAWRLCTIQKALGHLYDGPHRLLRASPRSIDRLRAEMRPFADPGLVGQEVPVAPLQTLMGRLQARVFTPLPGLMLFTGACATAAGQEGDRVTWTELLQREMEDLWDFLPTVPSMAQRFDLLPPYLITLADASGPGGGMCMWALLDHGPTVAAAGAQLVAPAQHADATVLKASAAFEGVTHLEGARAVEALGLGSAWATWLPISDALSLCAAAGLQPADDWFPPAARVRSASPRLRAVLREWQRLCVRRESLHSPWLPVTAAQARAELGRREREGVTDPAPDLTVDLTAAARGATASSLRSGVVDPMAPESPPPVHALHSSVLTELATGPVTMLRPAAPSWVPRTTWGAKVADAGSEATAVAVNATPQLRACILATIGQPDVDLCASSQHAALAEAWLVSEWSSDPARQHMARVVLAALGRLPGHRWPAVAATADLTGATRAVLIMPWLRPQQATTLAALAAVIDRHPELQLAVVAPAHVDLWRGVAAVMARRRRVVDNVLALWLEDNIVTSAAGAPLRAGDGVVMILLATWQWSRPREHPMDPWASPPARGHRHTLWATARGMMGFLDRWHDRGESWLVAHCIGADGTMGAGIAAELAAEFPDLRGAYLRARTEHPDSNAVLCGVRRRSDGRRITIANLVTKAWSAGPREGCDHLRPDALPRRPSADSVAAAFRDALAQWAARGGWRVAFPRLGCGIDGLAWHDVRPALQKALAEVPPPGGRQWEAAVCTPPTRPARAHAHMGSIRPPRAAPLSAGERGQVEAAVAAIRAEEGAATGRAALQRPMAAHTHALPMLEDEAADRRVTPVTPPRADPAGAEPADDDVRSSSDGGSVLSLRGALTQRFRDKAAAGPVRLVLGDGRTLDVPRGGAYISPDGHVTPWTECVVALAHDDSEGSEESASDEEEDGDDTIVDDATEASPDASESASDDPGGRLRRRGLGGQSRWAEGIAAAVRGGTAPPPRKRRREPEWQARARRLELAATARWQRRVAESPPGSDEGGDSLHSDDMDDSDTSDGSPASAAGAAVTRVRGANRARGGAATGRDTAGRTQRLPAMWARNAPAAPASGPAGRGGAAPVAASAAAVVDLAGDSPPPRSTPTRAGARHGGRAGARRSGSREESAEGRARDAVTARIAARGARAAVPPSHADGGWGAAGLGRGACTDPRPAAAGRGAARADALHLTWTPPMASEVVPASAAWGDAVAAAADPPGEREDTWETPGLDELPTPDVGPRGVAANRSPPGARAHRAAGPRPSTVRAFLRGLRRRRRTRRDRTLLAVMVLLARLWLGFVTLEPHSKEFLLRRYAAASPGSQNPGPSPLRAFADTIRNALSPPPRPHGDLGSPAARLANALRLRHQPARFYRPQPYAPHEAAPRNPAIEASHIHAYRCAGCAGIIRPAGLDSCRFCDADSCAASDFAVCRACAPHAMDDVRDLRCIRHQMGPVRRPAADDHEVHPSLRALSESRVGTVARWVARLWALATRQDPGVIAAYPLLQQDESNVAAVRLRAAAKAAAGETWTDSRCRRVSGAAGRLWDLVLADDYGDAPAQEAPNLLAAYAHRRLRGPRLPGWREAGGPHVSAECSAVAVASGLDGLPLPPYGGPIVRATLAFAGAFERSDHTRSYPVTPNAILSLRSTCPPGWDDAQAACEAAATFAFRAGTTQRVEWQMLRSMRMPDGTEATLLHWNRRHKTRQGDKRVDAATAEVPVQFCAAAGDMIGHALAWARARNPNPAPTDKVWPVSPARITAYLRMRLGSKPGFQVRAHGIRAGTATALQALNVPRDVLAAWGWWARDRSATGHYAALFINTMVVASTWLPRVLLTPRSPGFSVLEGFAGGLRPPDWARLPLSTDPPPTAPRVPHVAGDGEGEDESSDEEVVVGSEPGKRRRVMRRGQAVAEAQRLGARRAADIAAAQ